MVITAIHHPAERTRQPGADVRVQIRVLHGTHAETPKALGIVPHIVRILAEEHLPPNVILPARVPPGHDRAEVSGAPTRLIADRRPIGLGDLVARAHAIIPGRTPRNSHVPRTGCETGLCGIRVVERGARAPFQRQETGGPGMSGLRLVLAVLSIPVFLAAASTSLAGGRPVQEPPKGYDHDRFAPKPDILRVFRGFVVSFDSKDDDDGRSGGDLLRVPHWVSQELRSWEPPKAVQDDAAAWCLDTLRNRPKWFTDEDLFETGVAPNDDSYRSSGFDRGHMAMKLLVERLGQDAAYNTHTVLNAIPQRPKFNQGIWQNLEFLTGAWAQKYGKIWAIQGPVFYKKTTLAWIGDEGERKVAVPDAAFKVVVREKTEQERSVAKERDRDAPEVLAFLYPQLGPGYFGSRKDYRHSRFLTSVDEIEELTGLDFKLSPDSAVEKRLERRRATVLWEPSEVDLKQRRLFLSGCRN